MPGYPFEVPVVVRFRDLDPMGHVNNAVYVTYLEEARVAFFHRVFEVGEANAFQFILARVEVDFRRPLKIFDRLRVGLRVEEVGKTSFTFGYALLVGSEVVASGRSVQVYYDYERGTKATIPNAFRERLAPYRVA